MTSKLPRSAHPAGEAAVRARYSAAAGRREPALCCPVEYDPSQLEAIPSEVLERDYGCGNPSRYVREGDAVLDLGSGGGKICFIASQIVGPGGRVTGVDMNDEMLALARGAAPEVARRVGFDNVRFVKARIQDLGLDLDRIEQRLREQPVQGVEDLAIFEAELERLRRDEPAVPDRSVDVVVSNCVLNLVAEAHREPLVREIFRVLRPGGRIAISDIVSDRAVPEHLKADPELFSGCISGAFHERGLLAGLEGAGFQGLTIEQWSETPFAVVEGIEFRSITVTARRGADGASSDPESAGHEATGPGHEADETVLYRGPWRRVEDDAGNTLERGRRAGVDARTHALLTGQPYADSIVSISGGARTSARSSQDSTPSGRPRGSDRPCCG